jgi:serine/threonine protein kinase
MPLYNNSLAQEIQSISGNEDRIKKIFGAVLEGMQYAHEQGVIHRDLKPDNILFNSDDDIVISDFGLGRLLDSMSTRVTQTGEWFGTDGYMAPEQRSNAKNTSECSDVFSLGCILYKLYTGENPHLTSNLSKIDPGAAQIIEKCIHTEPHDRFQNAGELRIAFQNLWTVYDKNTDAGLLKDILNRLTTQLMLDNDEIEDLIRCTNNLKDDTDLMRELCEKLPEEIFSLLLKRNKHLFIYVITKFVEQIVTQSWGFSYVDTIGNTCVKICNAIQDPKIHAIIINAIVEVSVSHNRWKVMQQAGTLLMKFNDPANDIAIADALKQSVRKLEILVEGKYLNPIKLGPNVNALLRD